MEETIREIIKDTAESKWGKPGKYMVDIGFFIINTAQSRKVIRKQKLNIFRNKSYDMSYLYNEVILKNFVTRNFRYYKSNENISIRKVKAEIESKQYFQRNIIITGQAGTGKSTALKWLFLNSNVHKCNYIYLYAKMFDERKSLDEVLMDIQEIIPCDKSSVIFFDGLDELKCIIGNVNEFNKFISFFDKRSNHEFDKPDCKFVISTRPEHFGFNNLIIKKNSERSLDNYLIIELPELTKKEALKICKSIKKLYKFDKKIGVSNFTNKWPSKGERNIFCNEKEYLKILKKYLNTTADVNSLLNIPLLCRYAYQIICDWFESELVSYNQIYKTQSDKVKKVIECCIKWEFHDRYTNQTEGGAGSVFFNKYRDRIWDFLTDIAGIMDDNKFIEKDQWMQAIKLREIQEINEAFCVLQEVKNKDEKEKLCFVHNIFQNYFLARYYILMTKEERNKNEDQFIYILRSNSEFAAMFIEQLINGADELSKRICINILQRKNDNFDKLIEYARGNLRFLYSSDVSFTIEEYLSVFPCGIFEYNGTVFNKNLIRQLYYEGMLEIENIYSLNEIKSEVITSNNLNIKGIRINRINSCNSLEIVFGDCNKEGFLPITGNVHLLAEEKIYEIMRKLNIDRFSMEDKINSEIVYGKMKDYMFSLVLKDYVTLKYIVLNMIRFMGTDNNCWFLLDNESSLYVYQKTLMNVEKMKCLFEKGLKISPKDYILLYGHYKSWVEDGKKIVLESNFTHISNIQFVFDTNCKIQPNLDNYFLCDYYTIHFINIDLLRYKIEGEDSKYAIKMKRDYMLKEYNIIDTFLEKSSNEKLKLIFSDEHLFTFYLLGEGENMVNLAQNTIKLCKKYNHSQGLEFRMFLLLDETSFNGKDLEKVYKFAKNYIWI